MPTLTLAGIFTDSAVMQRGIPLPVWGWAGPGDRVEVALAGATRTATADDSGQWRVELPAQPAGGPHTLTVSASDKFLTIGNILIGEVWICSGQSNMEWPVAQMNRAADEVRDAARWPTIRLFKAPRVNSEGPLAVVRGGAWSACSPASVPNFSAVGYCFGRHLQEALGVAIGLIDASWGGTVAETWTSREGLLAEPSLHPLVHAVEQPPEAMLARRRQWAADVAALEARTRDTGDAGWPAGWAHPDTSDREWAEIVLPQYWQAAGFNFSGVLWFRRVVELPAAWAGRPLTLSVGACDKSDITYFNNVKVGSLTMQETPQAWSTVREYAVPAELVKPGRNVIAVRVHSDKFAGGMSGPAELMRLKPAGGLDSESIPLAGAWRCKVEKNYGSIAVPPEPIGPGSVNAACALFNGMIAPLVPYGIRGAIWYQGESNANRAREYHVLFQALIRDWRRLWQQPDLAFFFVQLANYLAAQAEPGESDWAELREAQTAALKLPHTGMAVAIDIGDANDVHPRNKQEVGRRLALNALAKVYGAQDTIFSGPMFKSMVTKGSSVHVAFEHVGAGLECRGGKLEGFAVAGEDRRFEWAQARIDAQKEAVILESPTVDHPVAVRYAWADNPVCNLVNSAGLPASPFRTDNWSRC